MNGRDQQRPVMSLALERDKVAALLLNGLLEVPLDLALLYFLYL